MMEKLIKNKKIILCLILLGNFLIFANVLAWELQTPWPPSPTGKPLTSTSTITDLVQYLYEWGIGLGGLAAFIALIIAGVLYLTSVGDPGKMREAKERIYYALGGLVFLLASWLILNTINPELTTLREPTFGFEIFDTLGPCNTDADCREIEFTDPQNNQTISRIIGGENCKCYGDTNATDTKKEGTCFCQEEEIPSCDKVILYKYPGFNEDFDELEGTGKEGDCKTYTSGWIVYWGRKQTGSSRGKMVDGREDGKSYVYVVSDSKEILLLTDRTDKKTGQVLPLALDNCLEMQTPTKRKEILGYMDKQKLQGELICKPFRCSGFLQLFESRNCADMMAQLGPTNYVISLERNIASAKFATDRPEATTSTPGG